MKPGGGKAKGSDFEREVCLALSLWISANSRKDLFRRTVLSGGAYTQSKGTQGEAGDIGPNDPLGFPFCALFVIECKNWQWLELDKFIWGTHELHDALVKVKLEAKNNNKSWLLICKQNRHPTLMFLPASVIRLTELPENLNYHLLFKGTVLLVQLYEFTAKVEPNLILSGL